MTIVVNAVGTLTSSLTLNEDRNGSLNLAFLNLHFPNNSTEQESLLTQ